MDDMLAPHFPISQEGSDACSACSHNCCCHTMAVLESSLQVVMLCLCPQDLEALLPAGASEQEPGAVSTPPLGHLAMMHQPSCAC